MFFFLPVVMFVKIYGTLVQFKLLFQKKNHYEGVMSTKVLSQLTGAEAEYQELEHNRRV